MEIRLNNAGKRYGREWIFRGANHRFVPEQHTVILGSNGSGKSTLLRSLMGYAVLSEGEVEFHNPKLPREKIYRHCALCAPYLELYEEFTLEELIDFQAGFKKYRAGIGKRDIPALIGLEAHRDKEVKWFSSGMKQRVRIALAVLSDADLLFLDEPTSNLDAQGVEWFRKLISEHLESRTVVVASNSQPNEYFFCTGQLDMKDLKPGNSPSAAV